MPAITCDACGGNSLTMTDDGQFSVCDFCGTKHTLERIRAKVQEIKGVVEVTKGEAEKERLFKNAETFLSLNEQDKACNIYHQITEDYPDDYRGWFLLAGIVRDELYDLLSTFPCQKREITLKDAESTIYEGRKVASSIISRLQRINYYNAKLTVLNKDASSTITKYEHEFIEKYNNMNMPFINALSVAIIRGYEEILACSSVVQEWADSLVRSYVIKYESNEIVELFWIVKEVNEIDRIYPAAREFLKRARKCAQAIDSLPKERQTNLMRALGTKRPPYADECIMWTGFNIVFRCGSGYDEYTCVCRIQNVKVKDEKDAHLVLTTYLTEIEKKLKEANSIMPMNQEAVIREILANYTDSKLRVSRYHWEESFNYRISKITVDSFEYIVTYQDGSVLKTEKNTAWLKSNADFNEIIVVLRKHSNKCLFCGGSFRGLLSKTCKTCGKAKNY